VSWLLVKERNVNAAPRCEDLAEPSAAHPLPFAETAGEHSDCAHLGSATYHMLTGCLSADAATWDNVDFDRHVFASILAVAATESGTITERSGLAPGDLAQLITQWFPNAIPAVAASPLKDRLVDDDEVAMLRDLLLAYRSTKGDTGRWLAAMVARRAMEPNHLWEDLGLRDRSELTRLLTRHFAPLAARNTNNMRWKRFFYRTLCEEEGLIMCKAPVCSACSDFGFCFGDESGESRLPYPHSASLIVA
jgi:nitrogen fixation protein NifQ